MAKNYEAHNAARRSEIIAACRKLYETMTFKEITIKEIGSITSFTRTSIYNYFQTKEEIFLAILQEEYDLWNTDLQASLDSHDTFDADSLADVLAKTLSKRELLLKILSMDFFDIEKNSRLEQITEFKKSYGKCLSLVEKCLSKIAPQAPDERDRQGFIYAFFPFIFGIYPYTSVTEKQREAMKLANFTYLEATVYDFIFSAAKRMLSNY